VNVEHVHDFTPWHEVEAPVGPPPGHTRFWLLRCPCGAIEPFPRCNYDLVDDAAWRASYAAELARVGCFWVDALD
jgi:hypothetical protein